MIDLSDFRNCLVATALGQCGVRESGQNAGKQIAAYQSVTWLEPGSWPWCAAFVCWCIRVAALRFPLPFPLPDTPRALEIATKWAKGKVTVVRDPKELLAGDLVVFRFKTGHHVGIVVEGSSGGWFLSVEGNTDGSGGRDGDGVYQRRRRIGVEVQFAIRF